MFDSFKNTELFRYFIRVDLNRNAEKIIQKNNSNFSLIAESIFSSFFSLLGTYFGIHNKKYSDVNKIFITCILFCVLFIIGIVIFKISMYLIRYVKNAKSKEGEITKIKIKEYIDDFDHIACDNILIAQKFITGCCDITVDKKTREFYYYELIYYTNVSLQIINRLFTYKDYCINDRTNLSRVHVFRVENALNMLKDICSFIYKNKDKFCEDKRLQNSIDNEVTRINEILNSLCKECEKIKQERYS